jgi:hypothetical protein
MCFWSESDYTSAVRTTITLKKQGRLKSIKQPRYIPVSPHIIMFATRAYPRAGPWIFFALLINLLENYFNE